MALHDFWCQVCGQVLVDVNVPIDVGANKGAPEHCGRPTRWMPQVGRMDASSGPGFTAFEAHDGHNQPVVVDSLHTLRRIERESEQAERNGEGQQVVWRHYSNEPSNKHVHALHPRWTGGAQPDPAWVKANAAQLKHDASVADTEYGPGIDDSTPSALSHLSKE